MINHHGPTGEPSQSSSPLRFPIPRGPSGLLGLGALKPSTAGPIAQAPTAGPLTLPCSTPVSRPDRGPLSHQATPPSRPHPPLFSFRGRQSAHARSRLLSCFSPSFHKQTVADAPVPPSASIGAPPRPRVHTGMV
jgi:hypothetical protein